LLNNVREVDDLALSRTSCSKERGKKLMCEKEQQ
jgi:hypothetical protein